MIFGVGLGMITDTFKGTHQTIKNNLLDIFSCLNYITFKYKLKS